MPESKVRKSAAKKKQAERFATEREVAAERAVSPHSRRWVPPVFISVGLLGVAWLVVYYIAGQSVPFMSTLGDWNILVGMGLMASSFIIATLWK